MSEKPTEPFTQLVEAAVQMHEWYVSLRTAGFTESEALTLMANIVRPRPDE